MDLIRMKGMNWRLMRFCALPLSKAHCNHRGGIVALRQWLFVTSGIVLTGVPLIGMAAESAYSPRPSVNIGTERFTWEEFDADGARLLRESGNRFTLDLKVNTFDRPSSGVIYGLDGRFYLGQVTYDGQTSSLNPAFNAIPVMSDTDYVGARGEAVGGYRIGESRGFDVLGGVGVDDWRREIQASQTANGIPTSSTAENYFIVYGKLGLGLYETTGHWRNYLQAGAKQPLYTREYAEDLGLTFSPGEDTSGFAEFNVSYVSDDARRFGVTLYYDSFRFGPSPRKLTVIGGQPAQAWQPESRMNVWGLQVGYYFF